MRLWRENTIDTHIKLWEEKLAGHGVRPEAVEEGDRDSSENLGGQS